MNAFISPADNLDALTFVKRKSVEAFVETLNQISPENLNGKTLIVALGTGGTISMEVDEQGIGIPKLDFDAMFALSNPKLKEHFHVESLDLFQIDSADMVYAHTRDLAIVMTYIWNHAKVPFAGFFIPHGTDTMSYSSAAISLIMGQGLPFSVVFTGAQKPIQEPINDANTNIRNALYMLQALHQNNMAEIVVVMGDKAILATSSEKIDDIESNAFDAPLHKYITRFSRLEYPVKLAKWLKPKRENIVFEPTIFSSEYGHTLVVHSALGLNPEMVSYQARHENIKAVILYSYGATTFERSIIEALAKITGTRNLPFFYASPVNAEPKIMYESGRQLKKMGAHALYMTLSAALAKIEIALVKYPDDKQSLIDFVITNYVGEIPSEDSKID